MYIILKVSDKNLSKSLFSTLYHKQYKIVRNGSSMFDYQKYKIFSGVTTGSSGIAASTNRKYFSRYSANTIMSDSGVFSIDDYDIVGFDLDNTLACYNLPDMINLEYEVLSKYLVEHKGYSNEILRPIGNDIDFLQKGLLLDADHGNLLKISNDGTILKASHGTRFMNKEEIVKIYGADKLWDLAVQFSDNPLSTWNGLLSQKLRTFLDYFDMPALLCTARIVDAIDLSAAFSRHTYKIWSDVLEGLIHLYRREAFVEGSSEYFEEIKAEPERYIVKTNQKVIDWLNELRRTRVTYLLTGSNIDFAEVVASRSLGSDWKKLFDITITYARKPGFFTDARSFYETYDMQETTKVKNISDLKLNSNIYSQGNWKDLEKLLKQSFRVRNNNPRCLYIGDNLIQDIYTPSKSVNCDTICIANEMLEVQSDYHQEKDNKYNEFKCVISSNKWGSYFGIDNKPTIWTDIILNYSKICVPNVDYLAEKPISYKYHTLNNSYKNLIGFYPSKPIK